MGGRTLRANLMEPLIGRSFEQTKTNCNQILRLDESSISYRQDAVENLIDDEKLMFQIQTILLHFNDVERRHFFDILTKRKRWNFVIFRNYSRLYSRKSKSNGFSSWKTYHNDRSITSNSRNSSNITTGSWSRLVTSVKKSFDSKSIWKFNEIRDWLQFCLDSQWSTISIDVGHSQWTIDQRTNGFEQRISWWKNSTNFYDSRQFDDRSFSFRRLFYVLSFFIFRVDSMNVWIVFVPMSSFWSTMSKVKWKSKKKHRNVFLFLFVFLSFSFGKRVFRTI